MMYRNEDAIQRAVFQHIRARGVPGLFAFAVPNGGLRSKNEAAIMKGLGVRAGVPDIFLIHASRCFALEIKTKNGRLYKEQGETLDEIVACGADADVAYGLDSALDILEAWGLLRGARQ